MNPIERNVTLSALIGSLLVILTSCAKDHSMEVCAQGLNTNQCSVNISQHSVWSDSMTISRTDPNTEQTVPDSVVKIDTVYEFGVHAQTSVWRRVSTVNQRGQTRSMFQEGIVEAIDDKKITLRQQASSCDDEDKDKVPEFSLYYVRNGSSLIIDTKPFRSTSSPRNIGDALGDAIGNALGNGIRKMLQVSFSLGSTRELLESGQGNFIAQATSEPKYGSFDCFSHYGSSAAPSRHKPSW